MKTFQNDFIKKYELSFCLGSSCLTSLFVSFVSDELMMSSEYSFARRVCALVTNKVRSRWWRSAECAQHFQVDEYSQQ